MPACSGEITQDEIGFLKIGLAEIIFRAFIKRKQASVERSAVGAGAEREAIVSEHHSILHARYKAIPTPMTLASWWKSHATLISMRLADLRCF